MKGYRSIIIGLLFAIGAPGLQYLGAVDWSHFIGPTGALVIGGVVQIAMRFVTTTPVGKSVTVDQS